MMSNILEEIRRAFDGEIIGWKNIALKKAFDEIVRLEGDLLSCRDEYALYRRDKEAELSVIRLIAQDNLDWFNTHKIDFENLRSALKPFSAAADNFDDMPIKNPEEWYCYAGQTAVGEQSGAITVGDLRRARAALNSK